MTYGESRSRYQFAWDTNRMSNLESRISTFSMEIENKTDVRPDFTDLSGLPRSCRHPAVHRDHLAGYVARTWADEVANEVGDVFRSTQSLDGNPLFHIGLDLLG